MPIDSGIYGQIQAPRINTPFENLRTVMDLRTQQENAAGLREQRQAIADARRAATDKIQRENAEAEAVRALFARPDQPPTMEELSGVVDPKKAAEIFKGFEDVRKARTGNAKDDVDRIASVLGGLEALPEPMRPEAYAGALKVLTADGTLKPGQAPAVYDPAFVKAKQREALTALERLNQDKPPADYTLGDSRMSGATNQPIATATPRVTAPALGSASDFVAKWAADRNLDPSKLSAAQTAAAVQAHARASQAPSQAQPAQEPLVAIMGPDGQPVLVARSQAAGKRPASNREQGRAVTSGDASDLADFDTSLDELAAVRAAISPADSTGIVARIGASLPFVTQITGWGTDAKKRQAVIDRVKQVIGKTLEGGVLRKEDEAKYEKILTNIADAPEVAIAKLDGLEAAIKKRKGRRLDALADAGYDTGKFTARPGGASSAPPAGRVRVKGPNGETGTMPADSALPPGWTKVGS